ncbi:MAG: NUDIX hydrolase [Chitinophagaceae bacterium]
MQKTIYFGNKPLILTDNAAEAATPFNNAKGLHIEKENTGDKVEQMIAQMQQGDTVAGIFENGDVEALLKSFSEQMVLIQAGGGLVYTPQKTVLLIFRRGKWDLPKGKLDEGENLPQCALREVQEETGLQQVALQKDLTITWHTYYQDGELVLKESHWYLMQTEKEEGLTPQQDEDIDLCIWVPLHELETYMHNTHPSIRDVIKAGLREI